MSWGSKSIEGQLGPEAHHGNGFLGRLGQALQAIQQAGWGWAGAMGRTAQTLKPHHHGVAHHPFIVLAAPLQGPQAAFPDGGPGPRMEGFEAQLTQAPGRGAAHAGANIAL